MSIENEGPVKIETQLPNENRLSSHKDTTFSALPSDVLAASTRDTLKGIEQQQAHELHPGFMENHYEVQKRLWTWFRQKIDFINNKHEKVLYAEDKPFKLKEDFRIYEDEKKMKELLTITTDNIFDDWATYKVVDPQVQETIGMLKRNMLKSYFIDEWKFLSPEGDEIGYIRERSKKKAFFSRLLGYPPPDYTIITKDGQEAASLKQHFRWFHTEYSMDIPEEKPPLDRRLLMGMTTLIGGVENKIDQKRAYNTVSMNSQFQTPSILSN
jgi:hypothetical protein